MQYLKQLFTDVVKYKPQNFIEIGSMDAKDTLEVMNLFSLERDFTYIVEASPRRYQEITNKFPDLNVTQCAIWSHDGFIEFNDVVEESTRLNKGMGSIRDRSDGVYDNVKTKKMMVPCMRAESWLDLKASNIKDDIHLVKIDTEGCDLDVLMSFGPYLNGVRCVQLEGQKTAMWSGQYTQQDIERFMKSHGYREIWRREWTYAFDTLWLREDMFL